MMGSKARESQPLPEISLKDLVPSDYFYRCLKIELDLSLKGGLPAFVGRLTEPGGNGPATRVVRGH